MMNNTETVQLDIQGLLQRLPHRYPFLMVDRVLECVRGEHIRALKNVTYNEPYFTGHFPGRPLMPGVLIIEGLAQVAGLLAFISHNVLMSPNQTVYFVGIDKCRFRRPVEPGDQLILNARFERAFKGIWQVAALAEVAGEEVAHAQLMIAPNIREGVPAGNKTPDSSPSDPSTHKSSGTAEQLS